MSATSTMKSGTLKVPGASLYYEIRGSGPVLLMMPGRPASGSIFKSIAGHLAPHCTVLIYDPRGLARSELEGPTEDERLVEILADDVHRLQQQRWGRHRLGAGRSPSRADPHAGGARAAQVRTRDRGWGRPARDLPHEGGQGGDVQVHGRSRAW